MLPATPHRPTAKRHPRGGFALLITITLVAFLVLLVVAFASLTRVETQVAANGHELSKARQNALVALNIALGELQKYTGPDQRTTARSDMDANLANTTTASGRWLGAYGNGAEADYDMIPSKVAEAVTLASNQTGSQAKLLSWLVSGNEDTPFDPTQHVGAKGNIITPPSGFRFTPNGAITGLGATVSALDDSLRIADRNNTPQPARLMIGPGTAGTSVEDFVVAPLRELTGEAPGLGSTPVPLGRYAWWVGDENAKARLNLPIAEESQRANAFVSARRAAVELVDAVNPSASASLSSSQMLDPDGNKSLYNPADPALRRIFSENQLPMLGGASPATLSTVARYRYHDLSPWSVSLLADAYAGGLKRDLSSVLADTAPTAHPSPESDTDFLFKTEPTTGSFTTNEFGVPTWGMLRSFAQKTVAPATPPTPPNPLTVEAPLFRTVPGRTTPTVVRSGLAPVMTYAVLGFHYGTRTSAPLLPDTTLAGSPLTVDNVGTSIRLGAFPVVVLWNPYTSDLKPALYEVGFRKRNSAVFELQAAPAGTTSWNASNVLEWRTLDGYLGSTDPYIRFLVETPVIPAGQSLVFTLRSTDIEFAQADYTCRLTHGYRRLNHVLMPPGSGGVAPQISAQHMLYRVGVNGGSPWFGGTRTLFGNGSLNFGNCDYAHSYLRLIDEDLTTLVDLPPTTFPKGFVPYDTSASDPNLGILQWIGECRPDGQYGAMPYGESDGYTRYDSTKYSGLLQSQTNIGMINEPQFWLTFSMRFGGADTRWLAVANPRAPFVGSPPPPSNTANEPPNWISTPVNRNWPPGLNVMGGVASPRAHAGVSLHTTSITTPVNVSLFEIRRADQPLLSVGQFQHANLSLIADNPAYPVGNSSGMTYLGSPTRVTNQVFNSANQGTTRLTTTAYDSSWLLNRALWDRYYLSTVPNAGTGVEGDNGTDPVDLDAGLPNPRMIAHGSPDPADLRDPAKVAANLVLDGGFNINSTSEQAWRAVLAGCNRLAYDPVARSSTSSGELRAALSRFSTPLAPPPSTLDYTTVWNGYRMLDSDQIAQLARSIVAEIRRRGPAVSLGDFTNRRLYSALTFPQVNDSRLSGVIQAAINATSTLSQPVNSATATPYLSLVPTPASWTGVSLNAYKAGNGNGAAGAAVAPVSARTAFAPQYLTQADVLSAIGPGLAARSDTFTVRAYGESLDPVDSGRINGRAWCEAVVQRLPEYVDSDADSQPELKPVAAANKYLGRRYRVVSFRWLDAGDI